MGSITTTGVTGGTLTIGLGGIGGDNCKGTLTDSAGSFVNGATVTFVKSDGSTQDSGPTNATGDYDIDVDGSVGDKFRVTATWTDAARRACQVSGWYTIVATDVLMAKDPEADPRSPQKKK